MVTSERLFALGDSNTVEVPMTARMLVILTSARKLSLRDGRQRPTGYWAEEFVEPHRALVAAGVQVTIATPGGLPAPVDEESLSPAVNGGDVQRAEEVRGYLEAHREVLGSPVRLEDVDPVQFDGVLLPGGHGPMQDLAVNPDVARVLAALLPDEKKVVASLCHGPAAFMSAGAEDGSWLFAGRRMTAFSDEEERQTGRAAEVVWLVEERLRAAGAVYEAGPAWGSFVVVDRNLITGQNPASAQETADAILKALSERA
jgi:putative intracellular protease/amidase